MNLFYQPEISNGVFFLDADESRHCVKVLRRKIGDEINLTDGKGFFYRAALRQTDERKVLFDIQEKIESPRRESFVHIAISPTKNSERIEWFVEKAVEFGIDKISIVACKHTERAYLKPERLQKVAVSAMKQSLKASLPAINGIVDFSDLITSLAEEEKFIAYVDNANPVHLQRAAAKGKSYVVLIGPEGDFSADELQTSIDKGFTKVSLGPSRLRTETAGLAACHILNLINE